MEIRDSVELVAGVSVVIVTPALVEIAKANGMPVRFAGVASIMIAIVLLVIAEIALDGVPASGDLVRAVARWIIAGVVYGLAAAGLYSLSGVRLAGDLVLDHQQHRAGEEERAADKPERLVIANGKANGDPAREHHDPGGDVLDDLRA